MINKKYVSHKMGNIGDYKEYTDEASAIFAGFDAWFGVERGKYAFDDQFGHELLKYHMKPMSPSNVESIKNEVKRIASNVSPKLKCEVYVKKKERSIIIIALLTFNGVKSNKNIVVRTNSISITDNVL